VLWLPHGCQQQCPVLLLELPWLEPSQPSGHKMRQAHPLCCFLKHHRSQLLAGVLGVPAAGTEQLPAFRSVEDVVQLGVGVQQAGAVAGQVQLRQDQVLERLLQVRVPDQHRALQPQTPR
jgi:hypothetical protein